MEGKSGASSRGNSSSNSLFISCCGSKARSWISAEDSRSALAGEKMNALGIFSEDCICTSLCGGAARTLALEHLQCIMRALAVDASAWNNKMGLVAYVVGFCGTGYD